MKKQILYAEITNAIEDLATALRKFSDKSVFCNVSIISRSEAEGSPDDYVIKVHMNSKDLPLVIGEAGYIVRDTDGKIAKVERLHGGVEDD